MHNFAIHAVSFSGMICKICIILMISITTEIILDDVIRSQGIQDKP